MAAPLQPHRNTQVATLVPLFLQAPLGLRIELQDVWKMVATITLAPEVCSSQRRGHKTQFLLFIKLYFLSKTFLEVNATCPKARLA